MRKVESRHREKSRFMVGAVEPFSVAFLPSKTQAVTHTSLALKIIAGSFN